MSKTLHFAAVLVLALSCASFADRYRGRLADVQDGDTFVLDTGDGRQRTVRICGIDCPEGTQPFTAEARDFLASHCQGTEVTVHVRRTDGAGRLVAAVFLPDGSDVALALVENGWAWCAPQYGPVSDVFKGAEAQARRNALGLWQDPHPVPPWSWRGPRQAAVAASPANLAGTITQVTDGDSLTLTTEDGKEHALRLYGVDAPEGGRPFSEAARTFVSESCLGKAVAVQVQSGPDSYGRWVARVTFGEGEDLGLAIVAAGLAWWYPRQASDDALLQGAEQEARTAKRGLWQDENPKPPWER